MNKQQSSISKVNSNKLHYLDGMRGLMAINVILCHFVCVYYPQMYFENSANHSSDFLSLFVTTPLTVTVNGNIAVAYFMVLTGFLVGMSTFTKQNQNFGLFIKKSILRYTRLLPVIFITTLITHITMVLNLQYHLLITDPLVNTSFLQCYCNFEPSVLRLLFNIFIAPFLLGSDYVGPFWTIQFEFLGYIIALFLAIVLQKNRCRRLLYICASIIIIVLTEVEFPLMDMRYIPFIMGLFIADLKFNHAPSLLDKFYSKFLESKIFLFFCYIIGIYFSCCTMFPSTLYLWWFNIPIINKTLLRAAGIAILIFASTQSKAIQKILSLKPLLILGEFSFETYAIHWPLMLSLEAFLFISLRKYFSYNASALLAFIITIPAIYIASFLMHKLINKFYFVVHKLAERYTSKKKAE